MLFMVLRISSSKFKFGVTHSMCLSFAMLHGDCNKIQLAIVVQILSSDFNETLNKVRTHPEPDSINQKVTLFKLYM